MTCRALLPVAVLLTCLAAGRAAEAPMTLHLDPARAAGEISPLIYGQFIEHLGWCIYNGIWAEMLQDRKFYHPVGHDPSPWRRVGDQSWSLTMDPTDPYVGRWSVEVAAGDQPAGITHPGLGVVAGKEYAGYALLKGDAPVEVALSGSPEGKEPLTPALSPGERGTGSSVTISGLTGEYRRHDFRFTAGGTTDDAALTLTCRGGTVHVGAVSLMPADNVHGLRADTLARLRELDSPIYRWPGGNFVSGYDWREGIGPRDKRPPFKNPAWTGVDHNDFGIDEFMAFCRELGTTPLVVVNTGEGSPKLAAAEVEYCNGPADRGWGAVRARNGHPEPYRVAWWGVGNEMYGDWQLGHIPIEQYVVKHNAVVAAMRAVDPAIKTVAVGDSNGDWSRQMLTHCADAMTMLSEHFYVEHKDNVVEHAAQPALAVRHKAEMHRKYLAELPSVAGKQIPIALDEWNYGWPGPAIYGEVGVRYYLRDALGIARGLHELVRQHDVFGMANFAQTVNVIGAIKTSKTAAEFDTVGLPLMLYRRHFGRYPIPVESPGELDVVAALTADRRAVTVGMVNPTDRPAAVQLDLAGGKGGGRLWVITGPAADAYNEPGKPRAVDVTERAVEGDAVELPPLSVAVWETPLR